MTQLPTDLLISFGQSISLQREYKTLNLKVKSLIIHKENGLEKEFNNNNFFSLNQEEKQELFKIKNEIHNTYLNHSKDVRKKAKKLRKELYLKYPEHKQALDDLYKKESFKSSLEADVINQAKFKIIKHIIDFKSLHKTTRNINHPPYGDFDSIEKNYFYFNLSHKEFRDLLGKSINLMLTTAKYIIENKNKFLDIKEIRDSTRAYLLYDSNLRDIESIKIHKKLYSIIYDLEDLVELF